MAVRNVAAGNKVKEDILKKNTAANIDVMELDLSYMASKQCRNYGIPVHSFGRQHRTAVCYESHRSFPFEKPLIGHNEEDSKRERQGRKNRKCRLRWSQIYIQQRNSF
ncbi:hypothetical protein Q3G72_029891 [Acer saccharum]|nr:hypothetical protein Q3G72_029891 [Acer saccharum]